MMNDTPTVLRAPISAPTAHSKRSTMPPPVSSLLSLLALIAIPTLIYAFFFAIKCPRINFQRFRRRSGGLSGDSASNIDAALAPVVKYKEGEHDGECPVCLSAFSDGEEIRRLKVCKHAFHAACVDKWLCTHFSCPVYRARVGAARRSKPAAAEGEADLRQGLPDSASLV